MAVMVTFPTLLWVVPLVGLVLFWWVKLTLPLTMRLTDWSIRSYWHWSMRRSTDDVRAEMAKACACLDCMKYLASIGDDEYLDALHQAKFDVLGEGPDGW